jgi:hypothetical protein
MSYSFATAGLVSFRLLPDVVGVPILWSLPISWICLLIAATVIFVGDARKRSQGVGLGPAGGFIRSPTILLLAVVGGLIVGLTLLALLNEALVLCRDTMAGGAYAPECRPWRAINTVLPWMFGGIALLVVPALKQRAPKELTHNN